MIIGIDGNEANVSNRVGIGQYAFELLQHLAKARSKEVQYTIYLKDLPRIDLPEKRDGWNYKIVGPRKFWTQFGLPLTLYTSSPKPDVFFTPSHYAPRFSPVPTVISVMDLSYIHFPQLFKKPDLYQLRSWTKYSIKNAAKILTISKASKDDIIKIYGVAERKVVVTYLGLRDNLEKKEKSMDRIINKYKISPKYILFVGTLQPRKNISRLIEAFSKISMDSRFRRNDKHSDLQLIIVGKKGWLFEEILAAPKKFGVDEKVKFLDFVLDEDLPSLYKYAQCFVLPSLYEGFGLPVLEAMQHGCPVITSNISSLPEAGGDAAAYIDPENVEQIADTIGEVLTNEKKRKEMIEKGYKQVKKFSWEKTAKETLDILMEAGKDKVL